MITIIPHDIKQQNECLSPCPMYSIVRVSLKSMFERHAKLHYGYRLDMFGAVVNHLNSKLIVLTMLRMFSLLKSVINTCTKMHIFKHIVQEREFCYTINLHGPYRCANISVFGTN